MKDDDVIEDSTEIWISVLKDLDTELNALEEDVRKLAMSPQAYEKHLREESMKGPCGNPPCRYSGYSNAGLIVLVSQRLEKIGTEKAIYNQLKRHAEPCLAAIAEKVRSNGFPMLAERVKDIQHARS